MAAEAKRGCGYRKVGGLYLVSDAGGLECCRLPIPLTVCPCCGEGVKQARGWVWVNPTTLLPQSECAGLPLADLERIGASCPAANPAHFGERAGLLWIGKQFYPTTAHFNHEAQRQGISRRIKALPQGFKLGEQWVLLAHPEACTNGEAKIAGVFLIFKPQRLERIVKQSEFDRCDLDGKPLGKRAEEAKRGITWVPVPDRDTDHQGTAYDTNKD